MDNASKDFIFVGPNIFSDLDRGTQKTAIEVSRTRSLFLSLAIRRRKAENARRRQLTVDSTNSQTPIAPPSLTPLSPSPGNRQCRQLSATIPASLATTSSTSAAQTCTSSSPLPLDTPSPGLLNIKPSSQAPYDVDLCSREQCLLLEFQQLRHHKQSAFKFSENDIHKFNHLWLLSQDLDNAVTLTTCLFILQLNHDRQRLGGILGAHNNPVMTMDQLASKQKAIHTITNAIQGVSSTLMTASPRSLRLLCFSIVQIAYAEALVDSHEAYVHLRGLGALMKRLGEIDQVPYYLVFASSYIAYKTGLSTEQPPPLKPVPPTTVPLGYTISFPPDVFSPPGCVARVQEMWEKVNTYVNYSRYRAVNNQQFWDESLHYHCAFGTHLEARMRCYLAEELPNTLAACMLLSIALVLCTERYTTETISTTVLGILNQLRDRLQGFDHNIELLWIYLVTTSLSSTDQKLHHFFSSHLFNCLTALNVTTWEDCLAQVGRMLGVQARFKHTFEKAFHQARYDQTPYATHAPTETPQLSSSSPPPIKFKNSTLDVPPSTRSKRRRSPSDQPKPPAPTTMSRPF